MSIKSERLKNKKGMKLKTFVISWLIQNKTIIIKTTRIKCEEKEIKGLI
jgi:hypothetical protein